MSLHLWNEPLKIDTPGGQAALARAHRQGDRVECRCRTPHPEMYIAAVGGRFVVKRMPESGPAHAPDCSAYQPPEELSGLAQVQGSAITESPDDGTTTLKVGFPLKKMGKSRAMPELTGKKPTEAKETPRKLTLTSLLHYFWHEADLGKWYPAMEGKRYWGVVHSALRRAAAGKLVKGQDLASILYVPEQFKLDRKAEIAAARQKLFGGLRQSKGGSSPFGVLIAEYKGHESTRFGARFMFKHAPDCSFFADEDLARRFDKVFAEKLQLTSFVVDSHPIMIATFSINKTGVPVMHEIGMMLVTRNWLPFENLREADLVSAMVEQKRAFQKSLRFNLDKDAPIASAVLLDMKDPVALFVADDPNDTDTVAAIVETAAESSFVDWVWIDHEAMPSLPERTLVGRDNKDGSSSHEK